jgi:hypothetical protein
MRKLLIGMIVSLGLAATAGAATARFLVLRPGDRTVIRKSRLECLVDGTGAIACGSHDHPSSYKAVTNRRGVAVTLNGKVIFMRRFKSN